MRCQTGHQSKVGSIICGGLLRSAFSALTGLGNRDAPHGASRSALRRRHRQDLDNPAAGAGGTDVRLRATTRFSCQDRKCLLSERKPRGAWSSHKVKFSYVHPVFPDGQKLWSDPGGGGRRIPGAVIACARFPMTYNPAKLWGIGSAFDRDFSGINQPGRRYAARVKKERAK